jgi:hypothetical protein
MPTTAQYLPTVASDYADGWLNEANAKTASDDVATATARRELDYPNGYLSTPTTPLRFSSFTGIETGLTNGDTLNGAEYEIRARCTRSDVDVYLYVYSDMNYLSPERIKLSTTLTNYTLGSPTNVTADYTPLDAIYGNVTPAVYGEMTSGVGSVTIEIAYVKMRVYWSSTKPAAMAFTPQTNVATGQWVYSNIIQVSGLPTGFALPVWFNKSDVSSMVESQMQVNNDGLWTSEYNGTTVNGDVFQIRRWHWYASPYSEGTPSVSFNGYEVAFSSITSTPDRAPTITPLENQYGLPPDTWVRLGTYKFTDFNALPYNSGDEVTEGIFAQMTYIPARTRSTYYYPSSVKKPARLNEFDAAIDGPHDGTFTWDIYPGTEMVVDFLTDPVPGTTDTPTMFAGSVTQSVNANVAQRLNPALATLAIGTPATNTEVTSAPFTVTGIDGTQAVTFSSSGGTLHKFIRNAETWYLIGSYTVVNGDTITLRMTTPAVGSQSCNVTAKIGTMHVTFCSGSAGVDITPDAFTFTDQSNLLPGVLVTSNAITLAGITAAQPIIATVSPGFEISINGGAFTAGSASCVNGNTVTVRGYSSRLPNTMTPCVVTIGGTGDTWNITTRNATPAWD